MSDERRWPALGGFLPSEAQWAAVAEQQAEEKASVRLFAVTPPVLVPFVVAEVERRMAVFLQVRQTTPYAAPVWPRRAAMESVTEDLVKGRIC
jgi:hypothetical protein